LWRLLLLLFLLLWCSVFAAAARRGSSATVAASATGLRIHRCRYYRHNAPHCAAACAVAWRMARRAILHKRELHTFRLSRTLTPG
jgi:hypothetical protein